MCDARPPERQGAAHGLPDQEHAMREAKAWECANCTLLNDPQARTCIACDGARFAARTRAGAESDKAVSLTPAEERFFKGGLHSVQNLKLKDLNLQ